MEPETDACRFFGSSSAFSPIPLIVAYLAPSELPRTAGQDKACIVFEIAEGETRARNESWGAHLFYKRVGQESERKE